LLSLRKYPDPVLAQESTSVPEVDGSVRRLIDDMFVVMVEEGGQGLAAPQVGVLQRIMVLKVDEVEYAFVNPVIAVRDGEEKDEEGCLSIPGVRIEVPRATSLTVEGLDRDGKQVTQEASENLARVVQHELDHLNGKLIVDYLSKAERLNFELKYIRSMEQGNQA
jgi:peptide deformylase